MYICTYIVWSNYEWIDGKIKSLGMDKSFHPTLLWPCNNLSMLGLMSNDVSKRGHWSVTVSVKRVRHNRHWISVMSVIASWLSTKESAATIFTNTWSHLQLFPNVNTLRPGQNGRHFPDDIFKSIFLNEHVWISINISLKFVPRGPINNIPTLVQVMAWRRSGDKPLSEPMMVRLPTHICITQPQWVNLLAPGKFQFNFR